jgi:hypothetical protein
MTAKARSAGTVRWTGTNQAEILEFCGLDRLSQPAATFGHFWDGQVLLSVWTRRGTGEDGETRLPVRVGETLRRENDGRLTIVGPEGGPVDTSNYE